MGDLTGSNRREDDRTMGAVLAKLDMIEDRLESLESELQELRDVKNKGLGMLILLGAIGTLLWSIVKDKVLP